MYMEQFSTVVTFLLHSDGAPHSVRHVHDLELCRSYFSEERLKAISHVPPNEVYSLWPSAQTSITWLTTNAGRATLEVYASLLSRSLRLAIHGVSDKSQFYLITQRGACRCFGKFRMWVTKFRSC
jgi:hypothetical protein